MRFFKEDDAARAKRNDSEAAEQVSKESVTDALVQYAEMRDNLPAVNASEKYDLYGQTYYVNGLYEKAIGYFKRSLALNPGYALAQSNLDKAERALQIHGWIKAQQEEEYRSPYWFGLDGGI